MPPLCRQPGFPGRHRVGIRGRQCPGNLAGLCTISRQGDAIMTVFTRRTLLTGAAVAGPAAFGPLATVPAGAAAPAAGKQAPSFYRYKVGSHEITVVSDGAN